MNQTLQVGIFKGLGKTIVEKGEICLMKKRNCSFDVLFIFEFDQAVFGKIISFARESEIYVGDQRIRGHKRR